MKLSKFKIFLLSLILTFIVVYGYIYYDYKKQQRIVYQESIYPLKEYVSLAPHYINPKDFSKFKSIVDMQPDDEADEPFKINNMKKITGATGQNFYYTPVPKDLIPDSTVSLLTEVLISCEKPVLIYCRTGKRAIRTYALSAASDPNGPGLDEILNMVKNTGHDASDLKNRIENRISERNKITNN